MSPPGSNEPLPEGRWGLSGISWAGAPNDFGGPIFSPGLGPAKIELSYEGPGTTQRAEIEIHIDWNRNKSPGTAGCVGLINIADFKVLVGWFANSDFKKLYVDWSLGTCPQP
jgi:lysozyme